MKDAANLRPLEKDEWIVSPDKRVMSTITVQVDRATWETDGFGGSASVTRSVTIQQDFEGSWTVTAWDPDGPDEGGGSFRVTDAQLVYVVSALASLIRDPDAFNNPTFRMHDGPWTGPVAWKTDTAPLEPSEST